MSYQRAFEREEDLLCEQVNSGEITQSEFNGAMRELRSEIAGHCERSGIRRI